MADFCFYFGTDISTWENLRRAASAVWGRLDEFSSGSFRMLISAADAQGCYSETDEVLGVVSGYIKRDGLESAISPASEDAHRKSFLTNIVDDQSWPLSNDWTGNFAAVAFSKTTNQLVICNDLIGHYPVYYSRRGDGLIGGSSLIVLGQALGCEVDVVGVLQRISLPYCNYGRRTLLKDVLRPLPGEWLKLSISGAKDVSRFDNTLCNGVLEDDVATTARKVWDALKLEINLATSPATRFGVAMSGGWDSRLVLGAVSDRGNEIACYTYGSDDHYESLIAKRCAETIGASHQCFPIDDKYFPAHGIFRDLVRATESANFMEWYSIIDSLKNGGKEHGPRPLMILGDLCESIDGRYMMQLSSRKARKRSFINSLLMRRDRIAESTPEAFERWKDSKRKLIVELVCRSIGRLAPSLAERYTPGDVAREVEADLELSFSRIEGNMPAFAPVFDELFVWFHRIRFLLANQIPFLCCAFNPLSPALSFRFLRLISTVHPRLRMRKRLMNAIARLPEFDKLSRIPSAQIPWLTARAPALLRDAVWGGRSAMDQLLIGNVLRSKDVTRRQRVLRSLDFIREYRRENVVPNVQEWFSERWIKSDEYIQTIRNRANLAAWPMINVDIAAPANVSMILDLCRTPEPDIPMLNRTQEHRA